MNVMLLNDLHLGCSRKGGTTPESQEALRTYMFSKFSELLDLAYGKDLIIAGDLFDSFEVPLRDWLETYHLLSSWLANNLQNRLTLVAGNHDVTMRGNKVSSFEALSEVLTSGFDNCCVVPINGREQHAYVRIVAHHTNQEMFDLALNRVFSECRREDFVILHANYANVFAEKSDHSLNVTEEVAKQFANKGVNLVFAHEHQHRIEIPHGADADCAPVTILGNPIPSSIADCLGNDAKYYWTIKDGRLEKHEFWRGGYVTVDWRELPEFSGQADFIRVTGDASSAEASAVIDAIHKFRQTSKAFVVGNAVKVEGVVEIDELPEAFEVARKFDVMKFIYEQLDETERGVIEGLIGEMG